MINVVIPMAGKGSRFSNAGYLKPKPFIDVNGVTMIEKVLDNLELSDATYILIGNESQLKEEVEVVRYIQNKYKTIFISLDLITEGSACTVLFARKYINNDIPLLVANSDQIIDVKLQNYVDNCLARELDGFILTFIDEKMDPKWSFAKVNSNGFVLEVQEKNPISKYATVGVYFFSKGSYFVDSAIDMIIANNRVNNEFYTCPVYNYIIKDGKNIIIYNIKEEEMHGLGTPEDLKKYIEISKLYGLK